jgi:hypothetical protein
MSRTRLLSSMRCAPRVAGLSSKKKLAAAAAIGQTSQKRSNGQGRGIRWWQFPLIGWLAHCRICLKIDETLRSNGAYYRSINDSIDTSSAQGMLRIQANASGRS